jgi:hypothetical protein
MGCGPVKDNQCFGEKTRFHFQGQRVGLTTYRLRHIVSICQLTCSVHHRFYILEDKILHSYCWVSL